MTEQELRASVARTSVRTEPIQDGYNIIEGLRKWHLSAGYMKGGRQLDGFGGVDIMWIGTSVTTVSTGFALTDIAPNRFRQDVQLYFNPPDVPGGHGFLPIAIHPPAVTLHWSGFGNAGNRQNGANTAWPLYGPDFYTGEAGTSKGICGRHARSSTDLTGTNQSCVWFYAAGSNVNHSKQQTEAAQITVQKQAQLVYQTNPGDGTVRWGWGGFNGGTIPYASGTNPYPNGADYGGANAYQEDIDCNAEEAVGKRSALANVADKADATHWIQINQKVAAGAVNIDGLLLYVDDFDMGVRVHNIGMGGGKAEHWSDPVTQTGLKLFGSMAGAIPGQNSTNARLWIIELGVNDNMTGAAAATPLATFVSQITSLVTAIQACTNGGGSVLFVIPPAWDNANYLSRQSSFTSALKGICDTYNCALLDLSRGDSRFNVIPAAFDSDGIHLSPRGHDWLARQVFGAVTLGL